MTFKKIAADNFENVKRIADKMMKVFNQSQLYGSQEELEEKMRKFYTKLEVMEFMQKKMLIINTLFFNFFCYIVLKWIMVKFN